MTHADDDARAKTDDGGFSVRAMVDAVMAPDVLQVIVERIARIRREAQIGPVPSRDDEA